MGLDLPWGGAIGFGTDGEGRDGVSSRLATFLETELRGCDHAFFSWQPRDRGRLRLADYQPAWDDLARRLPAALPRALHHTALNLATLERPRPSRLFDFTNGLCERYGIGWINEDVGFWSLAGRPLPYPMPPLLDRTGLEACVRNVRACRRELIAPLVLEFPGFASGISLVVGDLDAYDFFRWLVEETEAPVNLDIAHLLSWRWWRGFRGMDLFEGLERLPLEACFEIHLSGCEIQGDRFIDAHHGRLLDEQLVMLERLLPLCPNLQAITFEDPAIGEDGRMTSASRASWEALERATRRWRQEGTAAAASRPPSVPTSAPPPHRLAPPDEGILADLVYGREAAGPSLRPAELDASVAAVRAMVRRRSHRGTGTLLELFPSAARGWLARRPEDVALDELIGAFLTSPQLDAWRERPGAEGGACLEACFAEFARAEALADPAAVEDELLSALLRTLAVTPDPAFEPPPGVLRSARGWYAIGSGDPPILYAAVDGKYLRGPVTPLVVALLRGQEINAAAATHGTRPEAAAAVSQRLVEMGLRWTSGTRSDPSSPRRSDRG